MRRCRIISVLLVLVILFSSMSVLADDKKEKLEDILEYIMQQGKREGDIGGKIKGKEDFTKGLTSEWNRPSYIDKDNILLRYPREISRTEEYENEFIKAYKGEFESSYKKSYDAAKKEKEDKEEEESGFVTISGLGASLGMIYGEMAGIKDFESGFFSNWSKAIPRESEMSRIFDLRKLPIRDRNTFIEQFTAKFQLGYESAYYNAHFGTEKNNKENGKKNGKTFGEMIGKSFAIKDYYENRDSDYNRNMPRESEIIQDYALKMDNEDYLEGFINGFKNAYQESYTNSFREAKNNITILESSEGYENGNAIGQAKGKIQANIDHMEKKTNEWIRSKPLSSSIINEYNLMYQSPKYIDSFINGFWEGYSNGYTSIYKELSQGGAISKTTSETIPIAGGILESLEGGLLVGIDKGIYYKPVILTIDSLNDSYVANNRYISASNFYRINIVNPQDVFKKDKKIKISFEYYGDKDGGIYILENGKWTYLTSVIEEGFITAYINPSTISANGNVFGVLVDTETTIFHDIRGHWAKDEITAYIRRDVINGFPDKTFKPNQNITRGEFLVLLSRLNEWYLPPDTSNVKFFKDHQTFRYTEKYISYGLSNKYIIGYPDQYFRPYNNITYKEVDIIMKKILNDFSFTWKTYAEQMMYDKKVRPSSYDSYDNNITRAEFSYMLYKLNEWKY